MRVYVVEEDHAILYAGLSFEKAANKLRGLNSVSVWENGQHIGDQDYKGKWVFRCEPKAGVALEGES